MLNFKKSKLGNKILLNSFVSNCPSFTLFSYRCKQNVNIASKVEVKVQPHLAETCLFNAVLFVPMESSYNFSTSTNFKCRVFQSVFPFLVLVSITV